MRNATAPAGVVYIRALPIAEPLMREEGLKRRHVNMLQNT